MPTRKIPLVNDQYYHIYNRVHEGAKLFYSNFNYLFFLNLWQEIDFTKCCRVLAYCLMPNHYHFLLQMTDAEKFPRKISYLFDRYFKTINATRKLHGRFFENRFKNKLVDENRYIIRLIYYIHMNPVKAGLAIRLEDWPYSNYLEFIGKRTGKMWDAEFFYTHFKDFSEYEHLIKETYSEIGLEPYLFDE
jgi:putative transposase